MHAIIFFLTTTGRTGHCTWGHGRRESVPVGKESDFLGGGEKKRLWPVDLSAMNK